MAANSRVTEPNLTLDQSIRDSSPIVIFQCKGCKSILGDSSAFVASDRELEVICVNGVTSVVTSAEVLETSTEGADMGSTFRPLHCSSCQLIIGRVYKTTPKEFDHFRNMFCFDSEQIDSYQVGSLSEKQSTALNTEQILDIATARTLETRISKLKKWDTWGTQLIKRMSAQCLQTNQWTIQWTLVTQAKKKNKKK
ncbi:protein Mis18-alpha-like isoform X2 [Montipora capricornis]|uniref:protein Mis18-alpha-like isoform X2 n=1 Tax=Montipora capricornis TaxID=246305 RepID=UPI0035F1E004